MAEINQKRQILKTVKKTVLDSVQGILSDPDYGLELKDLYIKKLNRISNRTGKTSSLNQIKKRYK